MASLIDSINAEAEAAETAMHAGFAHAIRAGDLLAQAQIKVREARGKWTDWVRLHCRIKLRTVQLYMRMAREYKKLVPEHAQRVARLSLRRAMTVLVTETSRINKLPPDAVEEVFEFDDRDLRKAAMRAESEQKRAEAHSRSAEIDRKSRASSTEDKELAAPVEPKPPKIAAPKFTEQEINTLTGLQSEIEAIISKAMAAHPFCTSDVACEVVNNVYCRLQEERAAA
jgi:hypothetical protein